jgi:prepilin-type N-terminal cleavage/methylation domain-containing protein
MKKTNNKKGFTLIEVIIATFIFALIMVAVAMTFSSLFGGYKGAKSIQKNLENAQYGMSLMARSLRTSSVVVPNAARTVTLIKFYNYSERRCVGYRFLNNAMQIAFVADPGDSAPDKKVWCSGASLGSYSNVTTANINSMSFYVVPSSSSVVGKVTISMEVCATTACGSKDDKARIQSTVSLRDYEETMP